ncbi:MAG: hypothetical protein Q4A30_01400 [Candidatus Saccharibacteria bacterium]|nr:hypothetical protein [Candidatus Saccharibacteria bacterium]
MDGEWPDLRNAEVGFEITSAENEESQEIDSLYLHRYMRGNEKQKEKTLKRIEELGGRAEKYF